METQEIEVKFNEIIESLQGTCFGMREEDREFIEANDLNDRLDEQIFNCETCGWWAEASEQSEDEDFQTCQECYEDAQIEDSDNTDDG